MSELNGASILAIVEQICSFGPRWMGSQGAETTKEYLVHQFTAAGLRTKLQPFLYLAYVPESTALSVAGRNLPCEPIALSCSTSEPLKAPLVFAGQCSQEDLAGLQSRGIKLEDSILVTNNLRSFVAYPLAQTAGARGLICLTDLDGNTIRCGCARLDRKSGMIPAVAVGGDDGRWLMKQIDAAKALEANLEIGGLIEEALGHNVIGCKSGSSSKKILITAHYDSFWNGVHAMDNAAGAATVVALSRALTPRSDVSLEFVLFGGEELGLWGSSDYVERALNQLDDILAIVNLDTFGSIHSKLEIGATADLVDFCRGIAEIAGIRIDCWNTPPRPASDQHSFVERGVSAIWLANCGADQRYHTPLDVPAQMSAEKLEIAATLAEQLITNLAVVR